jgi:HTH-type transcriptional regulator/antitoxin MqsA
MKPPAPQTKAFFVPIVPHKFKVEQFTLPATYAQAGDDLVLRERERQSKEIRRIRRKLALSQAAAARLTGGGHNAFSRYERGEATPMPAVINLFRLLDKHPELLKDLMKARSVS